MMMIIIISRDSLKYDAVQARPTFICEKGSPALHVLSRTSYKLVYDARIYGATRGP